MSSSSSANRMTLPVLGPLSFPTVGPTSKTSLPPSSAAVNVSGGNHLDGIGGSSSGRSSHNFSGTILRCEELRKAGGTFKQTKKWFVLYDDNLRPLSGSGVDVVGSVHHSRQNSLSSDGGADVRVPVHVPAHLEYHDSEKKWRDGKPAKSDIVLTDCFNIYKKKDKDGLNGHIISVCGLRDTLDVLFDKEQDLLIWMELLLSCQQGGRSAQGKIARPIYENMWEVAVKGFKADLNNSTKFQISGPHRLAVTHDTVKFFEIGSDEPKNFPVTKISGHSEGRSRYLKLRTGWLSIAGRGELEMDVKDQTVAEAIINAIFPLNRSSSLGLSSKSSHHRLQSTSSSRSSKSRDSVQEPFNLPTGTGLLTSDSSTAGYRPRSESWSNPSLSHSLSGPGAKGVLPGHPAASSNTFSSGQPSRSGLGNAHMSRLLYKGSRYRTSSEGTHFDLIYKARKGARSIVSGSPMSPGSCMSSESAGSSNSLDDNEIGYEHRYVSTMTPSTDQPQNATIVEESSGESWVDPAFAREESRLKQLEDEKVKEEASNLSLGEKILQPSQLLVKQDSSIDPYPELYVESVGGKTASHLAGGGSGSVSYAQVECICGVESCEVGSENLSSSPSHVQYSTIVDPCALKGDDQQVKTSTGDDYMQMSSHKMHFVPNVAGESGCGTSMKRKTGGSSHSLERETQRLSMLGLDESAAILTSNITSPTSQSSYVPVEGGSDEYALMSPSNESGFRMAGIGSFSNCRHSRANSSSSNHNFSSSTFMTQRQKSQKSDNGGEEYVDMSPSAPMSFSTGRLPSGASSRDRPLGTSPSSALTSHLATLPLFTDVNVGHSASAPPTNLTRDSDERFDDASALSVASLSRQLQEGSTGQSPYLLMSPVALAGGKSMIGQLLNSTGMDESSAIRGMTSTGTLPRNKGNPAMPADSHDSELTPGEEEIYMHMDFGSSRNYLPPQDRGIPCASASSSRQYVPEPFNSRRLSPASSGSAISGTPNSHTGSTDFLHQRVPSLTDGTIGEEDSFATRRTRHKGISHSSSAHGGGKHHVAGAASSSNSSVGSLAAAGKTQNIDIPAKGEVCKNNTSNSPNGMAARLGSWFRHRAGSVPCRPAFSGRKRHRTQSEGENGDNLDSGLPPVAKKL